MEEISFTRKDGHYLRWDYRCKRDLSGKPFDKGKILSFKEAFTHKPNQIVFDLSTNLSTNLFERFPSNVNGNKTQPVKVIEGSCLEELPKIEDKFFDFIVTSPPYCNRYDYTRTYALELVYLGNNTDNRYLLTKGDALGGKARNLAGSLGERKFLRSLISVFNISGINYKWKDNDTNTWLDKPTYNTDIENSIKAIKKKLKPQTFFIGAAIENAMAVEIYKQLQTGAMDNAANLSNNGQLTAICDWLINL